MMKDLSDVLYELGQIEGIITQGIERIDQLEKENQRLMDIIEKLEQQVDSLNRFEDLGE